MEPDGQNVAAAAAPAAAIVLAGAAGGGVASAVGSVVNPSCQRRSLRYTTEITITRNMLAIIQGIGLAAI